MARASQHKITPSPAAFRDCFTVRRFGLLLAQVAGGCSLAVFLVFAINTRIVQPAFLALASSQSLEDHQRALAGLSGQLRGLVEIAADLAGSEDIAALDQLPSTDDIQAAAVSMASGIDLLAVFDQDGYCRRSWVFHPGLRRQVTLDLLAGRSPPILQRLGQVLTGQAHLEGLVNTEEGLLLLVARPIVPAREEGLSRGALAVGRFLTPALLQTLSVQTGTAMALTVREEMSLREEELFERLAGTAATPVPQPQGDRVYLLLRDIDQKPLALLHTPARADIGEVGRRTGRILSALLGVIALVLLAVNALQRCRRNATKEVLEDSEARYRQLFEAEPDAIFLVDNAEGRILEANLAAIALYRYSRGELLAMRNLELSAEPEETGRINRIPAHSGEVVAIPLRWHRRKDGTVFPVEITARFYMDKGRPIHVAAIRDISERRRLEEVRAELESLNWQLQKEESLGRMAAAIAHHFNNQLMMVMGFIQFALDDKQTSAQCTRDLDQAMQAAARAADISKLIRTYLGQTTSPRSPHDLAEVCRHHLPKLQSLAPAGVTIRVALRTPGPVVLLNSKQIQQVLTTLVTNSIESMTGAGWVEVSVGEATAAAIPEWRRFPAGWKPRRSGYASLTVADNGSGIEKQHLEKLFDPFFTSKFTGRGLGLPVSLGLIKAHDGIIVVESKSGSGSTFRVFLPLSEEEPIPLTDSVEVQS